MLTVILNSAHLSVCNYFSFIVSLFEYYVVLFHVRNKDNNNNNNTNNVKNNYCQLRISYVKSNEKNRVK